MNSDPPISAQATATDQPEPTPRFLFSLMFLVWIVVMLTTTLVTFILPESFASTARIVVEHGPPGAGNSSVESSVSTYDPYFIQTELEVIQSQLILEDVIDQLDLNTVWGKKYGGGSKLHTRESLRLLQSRLDLRVVPNTTLIDIRVYSDNPVAAAELANTIAWCYRKSGLKESQPSTIIGQNDSPSPRNVKVAIVERAVPVPKPVRPRKPLNIILGIMIGGLGGISVTALVYFLQCRAFRRQSGVGSTNTVRGLRAFLRVIIAFVLGVIIGYLVAMPTDVGSLIAIPLLFIFGGIAIAFIEIIKLTPISPSDG